MNEDLKQYFQQLYEFFSALQRDQRDAAVTFDRLQLPLIRKLPVRKFVRDEQREAWRKLMQA